MREQLRLPPNRHPLDALPGPPITNAVNQQLKLFYVNENLKVTDNLLVHRRVSTVCTAGKATLGTGRIGS
jgi:hypothetical protein